MEQLIFGQETKKIPQEKIDSLDIKLQEKEKNISDLAVSKMKNALRAIVVSMAIPLVATGCGIENKKSDQASGADKAQAGEVLKSEVSPDQALKKTLDRLVPEAYVYDDEGNLFVQLGVGRNFKLSPAKIVDLEDLALRYYPSGSWQDRKFNSAEWEIAEDSLEGAITKLGQPVTDDELPSALTLREKAGKDLRQKLDEQKTEKDSRPSSPGKVKTNVGDLKEFL